MAPTGQICTQPPQNSQSNGWEPKCLISVIVPRPDRGQGLDVHHLVAVADTTQTLHAAVHLRFDQGTEILFLENALGFEETAGGSGVFMGKILKVALAALIADRTIQRMIGQDEFEHRFVGIIHDASWRSELPCHLSPIVLQEVWSFGIFSTSTRHMRQFASGLSFGW